MKVKFLAAAALCLLLSAAVPLTVRAEVNPDEVEEPSGDDQGTAAYEYHIEVFGLQGPISSTTYNKRYYEISSDRPLALVLDGTQTVKANDGTIHEAQRYVPYCGGQDRYCPVTVKGTWRTYKRNHEYVDSLLEDGFLLFVEETDTAWYTEFYPVGWDGNVSCFLSEWADLDTNIPTFRTMEGAARYLATGDTSGAVNYPANYEYVYEPSIETPRLVFDETWKFCIGNACEEYSVEVQGRNYTIDDIELFKEALMWKYKYHTILKNDLTTWVSIGDAVNSCLEHDLLQYGADSFEDLLKSYPIEDRNYYGGTNAIGNYFSGYNDALEMLKTVHLPSAASVFNGQEIYVRFYYLDDQGTVHHGKWCHWYRNFANPEGSSGSEIDDKQNMYTENQSSTGLTDDDRDRLEGSGNSRQDADAMPEYNNTAGWMSNMNDKMSKNLWDFIEAMSRNLGGFPDLVARIFSFLPSWLFGFIGAALGFVVILRFLGR